MYVRTKVKKAQRKFQTLLRLEQSQKWKSG
jgi:hypothetical protein